MIKFKFFVSKTNYVTNCALYISSKSSHQYECKNIIEQLMITLMMINGTKLKEVRRMLNIANNLFIHRRLEFSII